MAASFTKNSALAKAGMNIVKSSVDGLEHFNPSNAERFRFPSAAEVAELKHYQNFFQTATTCVNTACPSSATLCCERTFGIMSVRQ